MWYIDNDDGKRYEAVVIGLNRFKSKYILTGVPIDFIENIRLSKEFNPKILSLMRNDTECREMWFRYKNEDMIAAKAYADMLNRMKESDGDPWEIYEPYYNEYMFQFD